MYGSGEACYNPRHTAAYDRGERAVKQQRMTEKHAVTLGMLCLVRMCQILRYDELNLMIILLVIWFVPLHLQIV